MWYRFLSTLWLMVIAYQWIQYTEPIWLQQTTSLVFVTLIVIALTEIFLPLKPPWRWTIKIVLVLAVWRIVLTHYAVYVPSGPLFPDQIRDMAHQFTPYIWFSLFAWALFEVLQRLLHDRVRILIFLGCNLVAFATLDSFTSYYLWENVAWTVLAGLCWLVCLHFFQFQLKYPHAWQLLIDYPLRMLVNVVIIIACILLIGISMPEVAPTLTDPYTAWINRDAGSGGGKVAATSGSQSSSHTVTNQDAVSGYSRDDSNLGGGFEFSNDLVMTVSSPVRSYWRGETRRIYSGSGWEDIINESRKLQPYITGSTLPSDSSSKVETRTVEQTFTMQTDYKYPVLFGGYAISGAELLDDSEDSSSNVNFAVNPKINMFWASRESELYVTNDRYESLKEFPRKYKVVSEIPLIPLDEIRNASFESLYKVAPDEEYVQIPDHFPQRVVDLAKEVTAAGTTPYQKMELLQEYLRTNFEYTNTPDLSRKKSKDFVDGFLFEIQQGYCDYFSTAMVMMSRSLGIPARWVKGFSSGSIPDEEMMRHIPSAIGGEYRVSNANAHSWAELYFGDYGWITFEATPGYAAPILTNNDSMETLAQLNDLEVEKEERQSRGLLSYVSPEVKKVITIVSAVVVVLGAIYWFHTQLYFMWLRLRMGRKLTWGDKVIFETQRLVTRLRRKGLRRADHETIRESFSRWMIERPQINEALNLLLLSFEKASYSPDTISLEEWRAVQKLTRQILRITSRANRRS
ncbi:DUF4129 domain-containing transglutaminase family protein [Paenibacillus segetis]|uniref:Protease n=1 Tax=Paenibacillus segetis TaxID=1325360 RepID=A0ABQ1YJ53_9BACL|nr:transglutaminase domain-containing protein [Paenibacillus segetis]GGH28142.1 protease [Paenibacillus segetis]